MDFLSVVLLPPLALPPLTSSVAMASAAAAAIEQFLRQSVPQIGVLFLPLPPSSPLRRRNAAWNTGAEAADADADGVA